MPNSMFLPVSQFHVLRELGCFLRSCHIYRDVFMSVPSLEPVEPVLWKKITKYSELDRKNKILLFRPIALYQTSNVMVDYL